MILTGEQEKEIQRIFPNAEELIKGDLNKLLFELAAFTAGTEFSDDGEPTERALELERLYDQILNQN